MKIRITDQLLTLLAFIISIHLYSQGPFDFGISTMDKVTGVTSVLIDLPGSAEYDPEWSPDGSFIAFDVVSPGNDRVAIATSSGTLVTIFGGAALGANNATWNKAGTIIAVDKQPVGDLSIYTIDVATGATTFLIGDAIEAAFSNKGGSKQFIAFTRPSDGYIYIMNMATGIMNAITMGENVQWSPNDKALVYSYLGDVYTIAVSKTGMAAGVPILQAGDPTYVESKPAWISPNQIVFHADYTGDFDIYKKRLSGATMITRVGGNPGLNDYDPDYDNNNELIAFSEGMLPPAPFVYKRRVNVKSNLFPNPANTIINLNLFLEEKDNAEMHLYDMSGSLVMVRKLGNMVAGQNLRSISLPANLTNGNYLLTVKGQKQYFNERLVIVK